MENKRRRLTAVALTAAMAATLLTGCGSSSSSSSGSAESSTAAASSSAQTSSSEASESAAAETVQGENWSVTYNADGTLDVIDMSGTEVTLDGVVTSLYSTDPRATYMAYCVNPDLLVAWNSAPSDAAKEYIDEKYWDLEALGGGGGSTIDTEKLISLDPDIIFCPLADNGGHGSTVTEIAEATELPLIQYDYTLAATADAIRFLGALTGNEDRAEELASYSQEKMDMVAEQVADIPEEERKTVYYAESADGLSTESVSSMHTEVIDFVNAINVAEVEGTSAVIGAQVSLENIIEWDPQIILCQNALGGQEFLSMVYESEDWAGITAVENGDVYLVPYVPFNFMDRPPSLVRVLGCEWLAWKLYPDYVDYDINQEVKDYYSLFYNVEITDEQVESILNPA